MQTDQSTSQNLQTIADHAIEKQVNVKEIMRNTHLWKTNAVNLVSTKRISPKVEIFAPYGRGYWKTRTKRF